MNRSQNGNKNTDKIFYAASIVLIIMCIMLVDANAKRLAERVNAEATETETEIFTPTTEIEEEITTPIPIGVGMYEYNGYIFIHCEVTETTPTTFVAKLPNGNLETFYMIQDPPIDDEGNPWFSLVWFIVEEENFSNLNDWVVLTVE